MTPSPLPPLLDALFALAIGMVIGLEREHQKREDETLDAPPPLGVRTFALIGLVGWLTAFLTVRAPWLPAAALLVFGALLIVEYLRSPRDIRGLTTEVAALVTFLLGLLVPSSRALAVAVGLLTTTLLIAKPWVRSVVPRLRRVELTATLQLLLIGAVVLPLLPEEAVDPWEAIRPRKVGLFVLLVAGMSYVGYVLGRLLGPRRSSVLVGILGGVASSTAVTAMVSRSVRGTPPLARATGQLVVLLANAMLVPRLFVVTALVDRRVTRSLLLPLGLYLGVLALSALWKGWAQRSQARSGEPLEVDNPLALGPALKFGAIFCAVLLVAGLARELGGEAALLAASSVAGLANVDAIALAVTRQAADQGLAGTTAMLAVVLATSAASLAKIGIAWFSGGAAFARGIAPPLLLAAAVSLVAVLARL